MRTSAQQAHFFSRVAGESKFSVDTGPSNAIRFPQKAPFDERLGYSDLPVFLNRLQAKEFTIASQARISPRMADLVDRGYFAPYTEKVQGGLSILDCRNESLFQERYPKRIYSRFDDIAPILINSLLYIENRELLDSQYPTRNPAVEWDRLTLAVMNKGMQVFSGDARTPGGSTLATQIEKYRHSPEGRTSSAKEKLHQMVSAALRAYQNGEDTSAARRQIVVNYLNTMPLSAKPGFGEVNGLGDGLWVWYGRSLGDVNQQLKSLTPASKDAGDSAQMYKQALSLLISQRRPSYYLDGNEAELEQITNSHLRLLGSAGIISPALRDAALKAKLNRNTQKFNAPPVSFLARKAANTVRNHLAGLLGGSRLYDLDRLDVDVTSTLDAPVQEAVTGLLRELRDPEKAAAAGLNSKQLLDRGDPSKVVYSFTLYERGADRNYLRIQTDNFDQPLNINEGTKLDLGSTAKLRTLVTYLDLMEHLYQRLAGMSKEELRAVTVDKKDVLSRWAIEYFLSAQDKSLATLLKAALDRRYSANPGEQFMTGGGMHTFDNFKHEDDNQIMAVRDGLRNSVNLVFIRLMRDIVHHYMFQVPGSSASLLQDADDPRRAAYLSRFADKEGKVFIRRFLTKYQGKSAQQAEDLLFENIKPTPARLASTLFGIQPDVSLEQFKKFINDRLPEDKDLGDKKLQKMYQQYSPQQMSLADRGYIARVHPLELWLIGYLRNHPEATQAQVMEASAKERQEVYSWLFSTHRKHAQDKRILDLLEQEGFLEIHQQWKRLGYPFESLVPSYATALGASADRPAALAELMGILVNNGARKPNMRIKSLHFASATPYDTLLQFAPGKEEQVLAPEVAQAVLATIRLVVEDGTARRVKQAFVRPDGSFVPVGGKTGTGDNRFDTFGAHGQLIESRVVNRSATFVFNIDQRFFGTIIAYVPGSQAADYDFTSALPVQLLKILAPTLMPLVDAGSDEAAASTEAKAGAQQCIH
ncbi:transglycosylase domain-containing protein [Undibacterium terreum]|uniref:peptidoglycan glycosyltransferase n=1 Tax=Undibacterium terreum TaxID=1224302 RepID=A0A916U4P9_9BURK|nr:transglycosylase domain-containing protein [Undibacterium terreum]GGC59326.1 glycosyl transferase family 51 [Undibacterium terreum]